jgi:hypothetical protein
MLLYVSWHASFRFYKLFAECVSTWVPFYFARSHREECQCATKRASQLAAVIMIGALLVSRKYFQWSVLSKGNFQLDAILVHNLIKLHTHICAS